MSKDLQKHSMMHKLIMASVLLMMLTWLATPVRGHETDQFTLPAGREFVDMGRWFSDWTYRHINGGVQKTNRKIKQAIEMGRGAREIEELTSADEIVKAVNSEFPDAYSEIEGLDNLANSSAMMKRYPGLVVGYEEQFGNIFQHVHFPLDPRQLFRIWHASTLKVYGTYLGTDKIGHFTDMGRHYHNAYRKARREGKDEASATATAVKVGTEGAIFSERGAVGYLSAGAYSNADLVANYVGFLFYRNLTDPMVIKGEKRPPLLERDGKFWKIAEHVENDADFFRWFISDHLNEALNPSHFESGMRKDVRKAIRERTEVILNRYVDRHGNRRSQGWFEETLTGYFTYYQQDYGHHGRGDELVHVAKTCFEAKPSHGEVTARNTIGETPLHVAARLGDRVGVRQLLSRGASINVTVQSAEQYSPAWGDTCLHSAVIERRADLVPLLLEAGAEVNARNVRGVTPLHRAVERPELVDLLLRNGADVNSTDRLGRTPLHYAAATSPRAVIDALLRAGARVEAADNVGRTPLHEAARWGHEECVQQLLAKGADVNQPADLNVTPLHLASRNGHANVVNLLMVRGCDIRAVDSFGWSALHDAADRGRFDVVQTLLENQAEVNAKDAAGSTPLHLASRNGLRGVSQLLARHQANVGARNRAGATPLHEAAFSGNESILHTLMQGGADPGIKNMKGQTAGDVAALNGHGRLRPFLTANASLTTIRGR